MDVDIAKGMDDDTATRMGKEHVKERHNDTSKKDAKENDKGDGRCGNGHGHGKR